MTRQGAKQIDELIHDRPGSPVIVLDQDCEPTFPLNYSRYIGFTVIHLEDHQTSLPMTEHIAIID